MRCRELLAGILGCGIAVTSACGAVYLARLAPLPHVASLADYQPKLGTRIYSADGQLVAEFAAEHRLMIPPERIPRRVYQAVVAAEDKRFYGHWGIDVIGVAMALLEKMLSPSSRLRGASTITQQLAKGLLAEHDGYATATARTLERKVREALLAWKLERALSKQEILYMYVHQVFLGHRAYGVPAAALNYFRKDVSELTLAEIATLAGLTQRPSEHSPAADPKAALKRRWYVLRRMLEDGYITSGEYEAARFAYVRTYPLRRRYQEVAPYYVEEVRRRLVDRFGERRVLEGGFQVYLPLHVDYQEYAKRAIDNGLVSLDRRQGYRGPLTHLADDEKRALFRAHYRKELGLERVEALEPQAGNTYLGVVTGFDDRGWVVNVDVAGLPAVLPLAGMRWARQPDPLRSHFYHYVQDARDVVRVGDVLAVQKTTREALSKDAHGAGIRYTLAKRSFGSRPVFRLVQKPVAQAALLAVDPRSGYVVAQVGGRDFTESKFNRATQACREPGSAFKPIVYAAAIENLGYTASTIIDDKPLVFDDPDHAVRWKPENYATEFRGPLPLRTCLKDSVNIPAIRIAEAVGMEGVVAMARAMGLTTEIKRELGTALGSSCTTLADLINVYTTINQLGVRRDLVYVLRIVDRHGNVIEDNSAPWDPLLDLGARLDRAYLRFVTPETRVMDAQNAYVMLRLLRNAVQSGTGARALRSKQIVAGKTGTTNDSYDAWFMGFTKNLVAGVWVGHDKKERPLGAGEQGGQTAVPIWNQFIAEVFVDHATDPPKRRIDGYFNRPEDIVRVRIDPETGLLAGGRHRRGVWEYYRKGTEPETSTPDGRVTNAASVCLFEADAGW